MKLIKLQIKNFLKLLGWGFLYIFLTVIFLLGVSTFLGDLEKNPQFFLISFLATVFITFFVVYIYQLVHKGSIVWKNKLTKKDVKYIVGGYVVSILVAVLFGTFGPNIESDTTKQVAGMGTVGLIVASLLAPLIEETMFRGVIGHIYKDTPISFIIISSILFGLAHTQNGDTLLIQFYPAVVTGTLGVLFAILYKKTQNIYVSMLVHGLYNATILCIALLT